MRTEWRAAPARYALIAAAILAAASGASAGQAAAPRVAGRPGASALVALLKRDGLLRYEFAARLKELRRDADISVLLSAQARERGLERLPPTVDQVYQQLGAELLQATLVAPALVPETSHGTLTDRKELNTMIKQRGVAPEQLEVLIALRKAAREQAEGAPESELARDIARIESELDLAGVGDDPAALRARIERFIEGRREVFARAERESAPAVVIETGGEAKSAPLQKRGPVVSGSEPDAAVPAPDGTDEQEFAAYLEDKTSVSADKVARERHGVGGLKTVSFPSGAFRPENLPLLRKMGVDIIGINEPSLAELERFDERQGWFLRPEFMRWILPAEKTDEYLARHGSARVGEYARTGGMLIELRRLTRALWDEFYPVYEKVIGPKPAGHLFASKQEQWVTAGKGWGLFYRDPNTRELLGAYTAEDWEGPNGPMLWAHYASYLERLRRLGPDTRSVIDGMNLTRWLGLPVFSMGLDGVVKGFYRPFGLMLHKIGFGADAYPEGRVQLVHFLNPDKFALELNAKGENEGMAVYTLQEELRRRYVAALLAGAAAPAIETLLGGNFYSPEIIPASAAMLMRHFYTDSSVIIPTPNGIPKLSAPLSDLKKPDGS